jgi:hypothetical protein
MNRTLKVLAILVAVGGLFIWGAEYAIHRSHAVGKYQHKLMARETAEVADDTIMEGMQLALQDFGLDWREWKVADDSSWQPTNTTGIHVGNLSNLVVLMINQVDGNRLYVRVHYSSRSNSLEYVGTRSK